jgi:phage/plasmid-associated DNA primase
MRLIKMIAYIPDAQQDRMLRQRIVENEGGRVLAWLIQGTQEYLAGGEQQPSKVRAATAEYRLSEDDIARFIDTELLLVQDGVVPRKSLYARYVAFMQTNRLFASMLSEPKFAREFLVLHPEARIVVQGVEDVENYQGFHLKNVSFAIPELPYVIP